MVVATQSPSCLHGSGVFDSKILSEHEASHADILQQTYSDH
jgi:hypothetical protein